MAVVCRQMVCGAFQKWLQEKQDFWCLTWVQFTEFTAPQKAWGSWGSSEEKKTKKVPIKI